MLQRIAGFEVGKVRTVTYYYDQSNNVINQGTEYWAFSWSGPYVNGIPSTGPIIVTTAGRIIFNNNGAALYLEQDSFNLTVNGLISAQFYAGNNVGNQAVGLGIGYTFSALSTVNVGSTGSIFGSFCGIDAHQSTNITNSGYIGGHTGIKVAGGVGFSIANSGVIASTDNTDALVLYAGSNLNVSNAGEIRGGIYIGRADVGATITNSGTIVGNITFVSGVCKIINNATGSIGGSINLSSSIDSLINLGSISGHIDLGGGNDTFSGGAYSDFVIGGAGGDQIDGGAGEDTASYETSSLGVNVDLRISTAQVSGGDAFDDVLFNIENLTGSALNDLLIGDAKNNVLDGGLGNDVLCGGAGNDILYGNQGDDTLIGGGRSAGGYNKLDGGLGTDSVNYSGETSSFYIDLSSYSYTFIGSTYVLEDILVSIENAVGGYGNDVLTGSSANNFLFGGAGNDFLYGMAGDDYLIGGGHSVGGYNYLDGGVGTDTVYYGAETSNLYIDLSSYSYTFIGSTYVLEDILVSIENITSGAGNDVLLGNNANNVLIGGSGSDYYCGRGGADSFALAYGDVVGGQVDYIMDFTAGTDHVIMPLQTLGHVTFGTTGSYAYASVFDSNGFTYYVFALGVIATELQVGMLYV
jgi:Ca2+-binding RTX toxin-like protein